jgi:hypothetical protein
VKVSTHFIVGSFLNGSGLNKILGTISPLVNLFVSFVLFVSVEEKLIFFQLKLRFLFMGKNEKVAAVIRVNLMSVRVVRDDLKIQFINLAILLWKYVWEMVVRFDGAHFCLEWM